MEKEGVATDGIMDSNHQRLYGTTEAYRTTAEGDKCNINPIFDTSDVTGDSANCRTSTALDTSDVISSSTQLGTSDVICGPDYRTSTSLDASNASGGIAICSIKSTAQKPGTISDSSLRRLVALTILLFSMSFIETMTKVCLPDFLKDRACTLYFNNTNCRNGTSTINKIQRISNDYSLYISIVHQIPSAIVTIFTGHWCDKYGRKPMIYASMAGMLVTDAGMLWYAAKPTLDMYLVVLINIPYGLLGGPMVQLACLFSMLKNGLSHKYTKEFTILISLGSIGRDLSHLPAGFGYRHLGSVWIFAGVLVLEVLLLLHVRFFVHDHHVDKSGATLKQKIRDLVSIENLRGNYRTVMKKREGKGRVQICLILVCLSFALIGISSTRSPSTLYTEKMYNWTLDHVAVVNTVSKISASVVAVFAIPLLINRYRVSDPWIAFIGALSLWAESIGQALAVKEWIYYMALTIGLLGQFAGIGGRSRISKLVHENEKGKVFGMLSTTEAVIPVLIQLLLAKVYNRTLDFFPGMVFLVVGIFLLFAVIVFFWMTRLPDLPPYGEIEPTGEENAITRNCIAESDIKGNDIKGNDNEEFYIRRNGSKGLQNKYKYCDSL